VVGGGDTVVGGGDTVVGDGDTVVIRWWIAYIFASSSSRDREVVRQL